MEIGKEQGLTSSPTQNKTSLVQSPRTTLGQETRWAYSTAAEPTRGVERGGKSSLDNNFHTTCTLKV